MFELQVSVADPKDVMIQNLEAIKFLQFFLDSFAESIPLILQPLVLLLKILHVFDWSFCLGFHELQIVIFLVTKADFTRRLATTRLADLADLILFWRNLLAIHLAIIGSWHVRLDLVLIVRCRIIELIFRV